MNVFIFPNSWHNNELKVLPNQDQRLFFIPSTVDAEKKIYSHMDTEIDCFRLPQGCCKIDSSVLKSAMDIIHRKSEVSERYLIDRLENIEKQVQALQDSLNGRFSHGNYK
jgi:hypothetical protein